MHSACLEYHIVLGHVQVEVFVELFVELFRAKQDSQSVVFNCWGRSV